MDVFQTDKFEPNSKPLYPTCLSLLRTAIGMPPRTRLGSLKQITTRTTSNEQKLQSTCAFDSCHRICHRRPNFLWTRFAAVSMLALALIKQIPFSSAWTRQRRIDHTGCRICRKYWSISSFGPAPRRSSGSSRQRFSTSLESSTWEVGDSVVFEENGEEKFGIIQETRGGGWFTVKLFGTGEVQKCRGTRMQSAKLGLETNVLTSRITSTIPVFKFGKDDNGASTSEVRLNNVSIPNFTVPPGSKVTHPPPPPTIHDLDLALESARNGDPIIQTKDQNIMKQIQNHASVDKWVVFTDLHCSASTLDTCLQVLSEVHRLAKERNAGVIFLGDFWHHRGTLRVSCLNAVLEHFRTWTVPMILIPGNHDQISLGGHSHGLTPLENAYRVRSRISSETESVPGPLVFSFPTKFKGALFVPHIRDIATMDSVLRSDYSINSDALFVHADITGACMNDLVVSKGGISPAAFPQSRPIYSGHFHKAHSVKSGNVRIEYLGSPYETSLSEAGQPKSLAVLDASKNWCCIEYIPMNVGRKHFRLSSWDEVYRLVPFDETLSLQMPNNTIEMVKPDDRVVLVVPQNSESNLPDDEREKLNRHIILLRKHGASVEVRPTKDEFEESVSARTTSSDSDDWSTETTWRNYIDDLVDREVLSSEKRDKIQPLGLEVIEKMAVNETEKISVEMRGVVDFKLDTVELDGFGPFKESITYPLSDRGLVLLRGINNDSGSDSNGSGKSSLAMSALWALTGSVDARPVQDGKVSDIINDDKKTAKVSLHGSLNGTPFTITRTKMASKGTLVFLLDGVDQTTQSVKETQQLIEEAFGISLSLLSRLIFHGQHANDELLDATDSIMKEELSVLVPSAIWKDAASYTRSKTRKATKRISEIDGMISLRTEDLGKLVLKKDGVSDAMAEKSKELDELKSQMEALKDGSVVSSPLDEEIFEVESLMSALLLSIDELGTRKKDLEAERDNANIPSKRRLEILRQSAASMIERCVLREKEVLTAGFKLESSKERVDELGMKWNITIPIADQIELLSLDLPGVCPTCSQPIAEHDKGSQLVQAVRADVERVAKTYKQAQEDLAKAKENLSVSQNVRSGDELLIKQAEADLAKQNASFDSELEAIEADLARKRDEQARLSDRISFLARQSAARSKSKDLEIRLASEKTAHTFLTEKFDGILVEIEEANLRLDDLQRELNDQKEIVRTMTELSDFFGHRGIQNYILESVLGSLQHVSQVYLDELSDGAQKLELSLDASDRITRRAFVLGPGGEFKPRPLSSLSGGQWRRCSLALSLGFAELVARRGKLRPSLCVLDEPLTHLDRSGRTRVGKVLQTMLRSDDEVGYMRMGSLGMGTILLILQDLAAEELEESFDCVDAVVRKNGGSTVAVGDPL